MRFSTATSNILQLHMLQPTGILFTLHSTSVLHLIVPSLNSYFHGCLEDWMEGNQIDLDKNILGFVWKKALIGNGHFNVGEI